MNVPDIAISPDQWAIVKAIIARYVPQFEVIAFGSRARRAAKPFSDLDLALRSDECLSLSILATLEHAFAESDLPFRVDVVDWATTNEAFRRAIVRDQVTLQSSGIHNASPDND